MFMVTGMNQQNRAEKLLILLSEDLRHESSGSFTIVGTNPHGLSCVNPSPEIYVIPSVAIYAVFLSQTGTEEAKIALTDGNNNTLIEANVPAHPNTDAPRDRKLLIAAKFANVKIGKPGLHRAVITLNGETYTEDFRIRLMDGNEES